MIVNGLKRSWELSDRINIRCELFEENVVLRLSSRKDLPDRYITPEGIARTVLLLPDEVEGLEDLLVNFVKLPDSLQGRSCRCGVRRDSLLPVTMLEERRKDPSFSYYMHAELLSFGGTMKILTHKKQGSNYKCAARVELDENEVRKFQCCVSDIYKHCRRAEQCLELVNKFVCKSAGEILSSMLFQEYGIFAKDDVAKKNPALFHAFEGVHELFLRMEYVDIVAVRVNSMLRNPMKCVFDIRVVAEELLSHHQPGTLFDTSYISPSYIHRGLKEFPIPPSPTRGWLWEFLRRGQTCCSWKERMSRLASNRACLS
jgi:hypothetical protein